MRKNILSGLFFAIIIVTFGSAIAFAQTSGASNTLTEHQKLARDIFKELIEINTTRNFGSTKAAEAMAVRLKAAGFQESDIQIAGPEARYMNLVVRYRGKGSHAPILFIAHLDVVEALRQDWSFDPFALIERDGYFYGRGSADIKCEVTDLIANLIRLKKEEFVPDRDIIVALTDCAQNALPQTARTNINCRMLPDDTPENVIASLKSVVADTLVMITGAYEQNISRAHPGSS